MKGDKRLIFTLTRILQGMQKYAENCSSFFCFSTLHAGTGGIYKFLGLIMLVFELVVRLVRSECQGQARNVERFKIRTQCLLLKAVLVAARQLNFPKTTLNLYLRVQTTRKQLIIQFTPRGSLILTDLFTHKEDSGQGITTVTDKEIQFNFRNCSAAFNISK